MDFVYTDRCLVKMVKNCFAVDCRRKFKKGSGISFTNLQVIRVEGLDGLLLSDRRAGVTMISSKHFASGKKSEKLLSPDYVPTLLSPSASRSRVL